MDTDLSEGDLSIHHLQFSKDYSTILEEDIIPIGERVRDLLYIKDWNKIILFLETSGSIALLETKS